MSREYLDQIDRLIQKRPVYKNALSIYRDLVAFLDEIEPRVQYSLNDDAFREIKVREGFPLFSREDLPVDVSAASSLFLRLLGYLSSRERKDKEALQKLLKRLSTDSNLTKFIIDAFLSGDEPTIITVAEEAGLEAMTVKFLANLALQPSLSALRESVSDSVQHDRWSYGFCPVCGSFPDMAFLDEQGKRFLHCELCGYEWHYPRLKCPFCENTGAKELGYFTSEEESGFRVDFCKKCKAYIKILDKRIIESPAPLELENLTTLHLDMLAHEQGFKAPSP